METLSILIMNWRDIRNPESGGAEVFTHEVGRRWASWGNDVTVIASKFPGSTIKEVVDGVRILRVGGKTSVYWKAKQAVQEMGAGSIDITIDEVNTRPFFANDFAPGSVFNVIHQLAREIWFSEKPFPINAIGRYLLEPHWLSKVKDVPTLVPSPSTRRDLESLGFRSIIEFRYGLDTERLAYPDSKDGNPILLFVGRMTRSKRPEDAIRTYLKVRESIPNARLRMLGDGYMLADLRRRYRNDSGIEFLGPKFGAEKYNSMKEAYALLTPSTREGWGMVVTEANAMGTPAIGYDVPGLCDSIRAGVTGLLVPSGDVDALASAAIRLIQDGDEYERLSKNALDWAERFDWDVTARHVIDAITS